MLRGLRRQRLQLGLHLGRHAHVAAGLVALVLLPLASWLDGSGQLAWTMFSRTGEYRLEGRARARDGSVLPIAPTALAAAASPGAAARFLAGADGWRMHDVGRVTLRRHLDGVAALACAATGAEHVALTLHERAHLDAPERQTTVERDCRR